MYIDFWHFQELIIFNLFFVMIKITEMKGLISLRETCEDEKDGYSWIKMKEEAVSKHNVVFLPFTFVSGQIMGTGIG